VAIVVLALSMPWASSDEFEVSTAHAPAPSASVNCPGAGLGETFADVYEAFAPLLAFHESYAAHLFEGSDVTVPAGLSSSCDAFPRALAEIHLATLSPAADSIDSSGEDLAALRTEADAFCMLFRPILDEIEATPGGDLDLLRDASDAHLFVRIHELSARLDELFEVSFDGLLGDIDRWCFAILFTTRTMGNRSRIERIDEDLVTVFYGAEDAASVPFSVPESIAAAMSGLIDLCGRDLAAEESAQASLWASEILDHFRAEAR